MQPTMEVALFFIRDFGVSGGGGCRSRMNWCMSLKGKFLKGRRSSFYDFENHRSRCRCLLDLIYGRDSVSFRFSFLFSWNWSRDLNKPAHNTHIRRIGLAKQLVI
mmetsp:Transcript_6793/g.12604  ORF Transcript_6793/g.12604 Transcript_6793/m.12604 type:complete len:105 (-) Transcript_6793:71-385(-)